MREAEARRPAQQFLLLEGSGVAQPEGLDQNLCLEGCRAKAACVCGGGVSLRPEPHLSTTHWQCCPVPCASSWARLPLDLLLGRLGPVQSGCEQRSSQPNLLPLSFQRGSHQRPSDPLAVSDRQAWAWARFSGPPREEQPCPPRPALHLPQPRGPAKLSFPGGLEVQLCSQHEARLGGSRMSPRSTHKPLVRDGIGAEKPGSPRTGGFDPDGFN